jgi:hypothetical protein
MQSASYVNVREPSRDPDESSESTGPKLERIGITGNGKRRTQSVLTVVRCPVNQA